MLILVQICVVLAAALPCPNIKVADRSVFSRISGSFCYTCASQDRVAGHEGLHAAHVGDLL